MAATGADFRIGGARAFYDVGGDYVQVPPQPAFTHQIDFYRTALHELGHWTGSKERLARDQSGRLGSALYAREELCALSGQSAQPRSEAHTSELQSLMRISYDVFCLKKYTQHNC